MTPNPRCPEVIPYFLVFLRVSSMTILHSSPPAYRTSSLILSGEVLVSYFTKKKRMNLRTSTGFHTIRPTNFYVRILPPH